MATHITTCCVFLAVIAVACGQLQFNPDRQAARATTPRPVLEFDAQNQPICPDVDGTYEDPLYCDYYWVCTNGKAQERICEDGLVFDIRKAGHADPCDSPHVVNCGDRTELQEATFPNEFCPRRHGVFEHPDPTVCNIYYQCVDAKPQETTCTTGLYFNSTQGNCNWPAIAMRTGCVDKPKTTSDGQFSCPPGPHFDSLGMENPHPAFPHATDCATFYICLNGVTPQIASCDKGKVFDERSMLCALPETVPECVGWYANDPEFAHYYDTAAATSGRSDPGAEDVVG